MTSNSHRLPKRLARLEELAYNLWWSWNPAARGLFKAVDRALWRKVHHNPVKLLATCPEKTLQARAEDPSFLRSLDGVMSDFDEYMKASGTWFSKERPEVKRKIAYFSAEFGVHNSLPIYSGGLGILAGDHCKSASDLGLPLVGIGFMYPQGYVQQRIGIEGWQQNHYAILDWQSSPVSSAKMPDGKDCVVKLDFGALPIYVKAWKVQVGRVPLLLMDTNVEGNEVRDRDISGRLYGGDQTMRLRQEIVLGIGGIRVLKAMGVDSELFHVNEGHAAFLLLERIRGLVAGGMSFEAARAQCAAETVFTTHTPVPAGHDVFPEDLIEEYFKGYWQSLGLDKEAFLALARRPGEKGWNMTALALRLTDRHNGVSKRNGVVSREMWTELYPGKTVEEVPISYVTNGVHLPTWLSQRMVETFDTHLGDGWRVNQDDRTVWKKVDTIPNEVLWKTHMRCKRELVNYINRRIRERWMNDRVDPSQVLAGGALLEPEPLTIGFARRFATYKRATLIFKDIERLKKIILDPWRPVQLIFAGKAHPADDGGKALIQQIYRLAKDPELGGHIAFLEDYDMHKARYLVQGVDVWLNNPLAPLEACGTSGQKAAANGVPNLSILDGWWEEGFNKENGWAPKATTHLSDSERDAADAENIYGLLEEQVVPLFYNRSEGDVPTGWVQVMKESIRTVAPQFSADRMVKDYVRQMYFPEPAKVPVGAK